VIGAFALCIVIVVISTARTSYSVNVGEISPSTITAPWDIVDEVSTNALIEEERAKVAPIYYQDEDITKESLSSLDAAFDAVAAANKAAHDAYISNKVAELQAAEDERVRVENEKIMANQNTQGGSPELVKAKTFTQEDVEFDAPSVDWATALTDEQRSSIVKALPDYLSFNEVNDIFALSNQDLAVVLDGCRTASESFLAQGIKTENILSVCSEIESAVFADAADGVALYCSFVEPVLVNTIDANLIFDDEATKKAQDEAEKAVVPITYIHGQNIVVKGEIVTQTQYNVLEQTGLINQTMSVDVYAPVAIYLILVFAIYLIYLCVFVKEIASSTKKMLIISILTVLAVIFCVITNELAPSVFMIFSIAIMAAALIPVKQAVAFSVFVSFVLIAFSSDSLLFFTDASLRTLIISVFGSIIAIVMVKKIPVRAASLLAGLITSGVVIVVYMIMLLMGSITTDAFGSLALWAVAGGFFCGIVSLGLLPVFEGTFKILTPAKLVELADPRRKLLKRLMLEAPGTYYHSLYVGNLAENACEAIGANSLLARVGAYYHDIGKLQAPEYFVENQNGENTHDELAPEESARIITSHVTDGRKFGEKEKLPIEIINIISEHHGNTKVAYFLHKAKENNPDVNENDFRYNASRPTSIESAVIMLADSVEAAMRAIKADTEEEVLAAIRKIIRAKYNDGQLDFTPLTLRDLDIVAQAFAASYKGVEHKRIKYPEEKKKG